MSAHDPKVESINQQKTFCRICEAHCGLRIETDSAGALTHIRPDRAHPISQGFICAKGTQFLEVANHLDRLLFPMRRRKDGAFERVAWEDALAYFRDRIRPILEQYGPHAIALYLGTPTIHNMLGGLAYFAFARALGTRNLYSAASQDNDSKIVAARLVHGSEYIQPIMDLEQADFALLLGTNPAVTQGTYLHMHGGTKAYDRDWRSAPSQGAFVASETVIQATHSSEVRASKPKAKERDLTMPGSLVQALIAHFDSVFEGPNGDYPAVLEAVAGVSVIQALWKPTPTQNSIWQIVEHLIASKEWQIEMLEHGQATSPAWVEPSGDEATWQASLALLKDAHHRLKLALERVVEADLLRVPVPEERCTLLELLLSSGPAHEAHHSGQIDYLRGLQAG